MARGRVFGNIYLTEKQGAVEFDAGDEWALVVLAAQAGMAVENAHLNEELEARVARLDALHAISTAIVQGEDTDAVTTLVGTATLGRCCVPIWPAWRCRPGTASTWRSGRPTASRQGTCSARCSPPRGRSRGT